LALLVALIAAPALAQDDDRAGWTVDQWMSEYYGQKEAGAEPEDLRVLLEGADAAVDADADPDTAQRITAELGYQWLADADKVRSGKAFIRAAAGPDEELSARIQTELEALQAHWRTTAEQYKHLGELARADAALKFAAELGADPQVIAFERSYVALLDGDKEKALELLEEATVGPNEEVAAQAEAQLAASRPPPQPDWYLALEEGNAHREAEEWEEADAAYDRAVEEGADVQLVELLRGYVDKGNRKDFAARSHFQAAAGGDDEDLAKQARAELRYTAKPVWADVYFEGYAWHRFHPTTFSNFVPFLRLRGYLHPIPHVDLDPYIFFQISRDVASRAQGPQGFPLIYADNTAMLGGGVLFRFWKRRVSLFAQVGAAFPLVDIGQEKVQLDVRAGAVFAIESPGCRLEFGAPVYTTLQFCGDVYAEAIYLLRPEHNFFISARGRVSLHYLVTGPVAWAPFGEVRIAKDARNDFWNNLIDFGVGHRWRLGGPVGIDLNLGIHAGTYFGLFSIDPPPETLGYAELRAILAGYASW